MPFAGFPEKDNSEYTLLVKAEDETLRRFFKDQIEANKPLLPRLYRSEGPAAREEAYVTSTSDCMVLMEDIGVAQRALLRIAFNRKVTEEFDITISSINRRKTEDAYYIHEPYKDAAEDAKPHTYLAYEQHRGYPSWINFVPLFRRAFFLLWDGRGHRSEMRYRGANWLHLQGNWARVLRDKNESMITHLSITSDRPDLKNFASIDSSARIQAIWRKFYKAWGQVAPENPEYNFPDIQRLCFVPHKSQVRWPTNASDWNHIGPYSTLVYLTMAYVRTDTSMGINEPYTDSFLRFLYKVQRRRWPLGTQTVNRVSEPRFMGEGDNGGYERMAALLLRDTMIARGAVAPVQPDARCAYLVIDPHFTEYCLAGVDALEAVMAFATYTPDDRNSYELFRTQAKSDVQVKQWWDALGDVFEPERVDEHMQAQSNLIALAKAYHAARWYPSLIVADAKRLHGDDFTKAELYIQKLGVLPVYAEKQSRKSRGKRYAWLEAMREVRQGQLYNQSM